MSEYLFVEKPFLDHLRALGWEVIDQGTHASTSDREASLRDIFREVTLRRVFYETVRGINIGDISGGTACLVLTAAKWATSEARICHRAGCG